LVVQKDEIDSILLLNFKQSLQKLKFRGAKKVLSEAYEYILKNDL
ncbi:MAG: hypothetical protein GX219_07870, partial [Tissierellia bacterium]|nr:hypothetical protein [Tissierellia bacterium]